MDVEMTLSKCNFGETMGDECHRLSHTRIQGMEKLSDYCADMQEIFLMRAGMTLQQDKTNITICIHHSKMLSGVFERRFNKCCNIFNIHKGKVKGGHNITLDLAKKLRQKGFNAIPGWQLCRNCFKKVTIEEQNDKSQTDNDTDCEISEIAREIARDDAKDLMNTSLEELAVSPMKTHSLSKQRKISEAKSKIDRACASIEDRVASVLDVDSADLKRKDPHATISPSIQAKAADLDTLTYCIL